MPPFLFTFFIHDGYCYGDPDALVYLFLMQPASVMYICLQVEITWQMRAMMWLCDPPTQSGKVWPTKCVREIVVQQEV